MPELEKFSFTKRIKSFSYALTGLKYFFRTQHNAWIHLIAIVIVALAGLYFQVSNTEWISIATVAGFVFSAEIFNTAIELIVDWISPQHHKKAGLIKDIAAGAVLISAVVSVLVGFIIFLPKIIVRFF